MAVYQLVTPTVVDASVSQLHEYHSYINDVIDTKLHGLTGDENEIISIVVDSELSEAEIRAMEDYLGISIKLTDQY